ncbi:MAG: PH domain-containing protein, partial [Flavobacteriales bacterium]
MYYFRCRIIASPNGLEIRGMFYKRFIEWSDIRDFYFEVRSGGSKTNDLAFIEYGTRKQILSQLFENRPALLEYIELKATNARTRKFEFKETRDINETPIIFDYG